MHAWLNRSNWVEIHRIDQAYEADDAQFDQASSQWISTQFDHPIRPIQPGIISMNWVVELVKLGIISMDFHPIQPPNLTRQAYNVISMDFHPIRPGRHTM